MYFPTPDDRMAMDLNSKTKGSSMKRLTVFLPLVLAACATQQGPTLTPMARTPAAVPADDPAATSNPLHYEIHPRPRTKAASLEALRVANASAMRTVTDGTFKGAALRM